MINQQVKTGKYQDNLAVIQEGLCLLAEREKNYQKIIEELKQEVMIGVEELRRGETLDARQVIKRLKAKNT